MHIRLYGNDIDELSKLEKFLVSEKHSVEIYDLSSGYEFSKEEFNSFNNAVLPIQRELYNEEDYEEVRKLSKTYENFNKSRHKIKGIIATCNNNIIYNFTKEQIEDLLKGHTRKKVFSFDFLSPFLHLIVLSILIQVIASNIVYRTLDILPNEITADNYLDFLIKYMPINFMMELIYIFLILMFFYRYRMKQQLENIKLINLVKKTFIYSVLVLIFIFIMQFIFNSVIKLDFISYVSGDAEKIISEFGLTNFLVVVTLILSAIVEEILYRFMLIDDILSSVKKPIKQAFSSALIFSLIHSTSELVSFELSTFILIVFVYFVPSFFFSLLYVKEKNIVLNILVHIVFNITILLLLIY